MIRFLKVEGGKVRSKSRVIRTLARVATASYKVDSHGIESCLSEHISRIFYFLFVFFSYWMDNGLHAKEQSFIPRLVP